VVIAVRPAADLEAKWQRLRGRIEARAHLLGHQGSLARKRCWRRWVWQLRYYEPGPGGAVVQRALYVGADPELACRARALLDFYREE
jgi:hypothetical protein